MLRLPARVDCEKCGEVYEETWDDDSDTIEDMAEPPVKDSRCPGCGHVHEDMEWPGWMFRSEAG